MVETYKQLENHRIFEPIKVACDMDDKAKKTEQTHDKITEVVTYLTLYIDKNSTQDLLPTRLGDGIAVNNILGPPKFCNWKIIPDITK